MSERIGIAPPPSLPSSSSSCLYFLRSQSPTFVGVGCQSSLSSHTRNIRISLTLTLSSKTTTHRIQAGAEGFTKPSPPQSQDDDDGSSSSPPPLDPLVDSPVSIQLQPILSDVQFDTIMAELQQVGGALVIIWMATWCRKCIYLKPKLEKLAAEYYPKIRFYSIDVNAVPHKLVARAGVTKMPTVQVWKDSKKQAEVIGGHKAYLVVNEVREMIENVCSLSL